MNYLRAIVILAAEELGKLTKVVSFISILISTLLVTTSHTSVIVLVHQRSKTGQAAIEL